MAAHRTATVDWIGDLLDGFGTVRPVEGGSIPEVEVTWRQRTDSSNAGATPEEFLAASHASCYSMALAAGFVGQGFEPEELHVSATVTFENGVGITASQLSVTGIVDGASDEKWREIAGRAKDTCPVSKALAGIEITLVLPDIPDVVEEEPEAADDDEAAGDAADSTEG